jgi:uncharacterized membrane protein YkvA (DUF1232 family)
MSRSSLSGWLLKAGLFRSTIGQAGLAWKLFKDKRVPTTAKAIPVLALLYVLSPIDLALDWIPVLGQMDDVAIIGLGLQAFIRAAPQYVVSEYQSESERQAQRETRASEQTRQPVHEM